MEGLDKYLTDEPNTRIRPVPKPEKRPKKQPTKIKRRSKKREAQEKAYLLIRKAFLIKNPICAVTGKLATEVHHKKGREGDLLTDVRYFLPVSREGHRWIEANPTKAKELGFSLNRTG